MNYQNKSNKLLNYFFLYLALKPNFSNLIGDVLGLWIPEIIGWVFLIYTMKYINLTVYKRLNALIIFSFVVLNLITIEINLISNQVVVFSDFIEIVRWGMYFIFYGFVSSHKVNKECLTKIIIAINCINFFIIISDMLNLPWETIFVYIYKMDISISFWNSYNRASGTFGNPNFLGLWMEISFFIIALGYQGRKMYKNIFLSMTGIMLIFSGSRTAIFIFLYCIVLSIFNYMNMKNKIKFILLMGFIVTMTIFILNNMQVYPFFISRILKNLGDLNGRTSIWIESLNHIGNNIIFGLGPSKSDFKVFDNYYIEVFVRYGIIGFGLFIVMIVCNFIISIKRTFINKTFFLNLIIITSLTMGMLTMSIFRIFIFVAILLIYYSDLYNKIVYGKVLSSKGNIKK